VGSDETAGIVPQRREVIVRGAGPLQVVDDPVAQHPLGGVNEEVVILQSWVLGGKLFQRLGVFGPELHLRRLFLHHLPNGVAVDTRPGAVDDLAEGLGTFFGVSNLDFLCQAAQVVLIRVVVLGGHGSQSFGLWLLSWRRGFQFKLALILLLLRLGGSDTLLRPAAPRRP
jgi:hypothetical protein